MNHSLKDRLAGARTVLQRRRWLSGLIRNLLTVFVLLLGLAALNALAPLRESQAFVLLIPVVVLFLASLLWDTYRAFLAPPSLTQLAVEIEKRNPRWMDALICAVEREERPSQGLGELERALIEKMRRETANVNFTELLISTRQRTGTLACGAVLVLLLVWPALGNPFSQKSFAYFSDLMSGAPSGLAVTPGNAEIPVETDATIGVEIFRWENEARVEYVDSRGEYDYAMHSGAGGEHSFTFYGVEDPVRYRVTTPSLTSVWYRITPYVPPAIESLQVTATPPAYSGEEPRTFSRIRDFTVLEGSTLRWELTLPEGVSATWSGEDEEHALVADSPTRRTLERRLDGDMRARFVLEDADGRTAESPPFEVTARPDYPPTLDVKRPGRDTDAEPDGGVDIEAVAADDFGLREVRLTYSVSGDRRVTRELYAADGAVSPAELSREEIVRQVLDLENLEVEAGDVITYFLTAADNREPEAQRTRSEVFFIEIREEREPEEMDGEPMEREEIDIRALLVETKRLIRMSWESLSVDGERREELTEELALSMESLRIETSGIEQEIVELAGGNDTLPVIQLMRGAIERMTSAGRLIRAGEVEDSIPYQEQALAQLLAVENELARDPVRSDEPSEEGESGSGSTGQGEPGEEEMEELLADLRRLDEDIRRLADEQADRNSATGRLAGTAVSEAERNELRERQEALTDEARRIRRELNEVPRVGEVWRQMDAAAGSMDRAARQAGRGELGAAEREGARARGALLAAGEELRALLERATDSEMGELARRAEALAEEQAAAAGASRATAGQDSPDAGELAELRARQDEIKDSWEDLLSDLDDDSLEMMDEHPEVAEALFELARRMRDENVAGEMDRAANALLYRQAGRAGEIQEAIAERLSGFVDGLREATAGLPSVSRQEVAEALQDVRRARAEVEDMFGQAGEEANARMRAISSRTGEGIGEIAEGLNDEQLRELSGSLLGAEGAGAERPNPLRLESMLSAADRSLEQRLLSMEIERRERLSRQGSEPPEKYRDLVEQYFRNLSETP